MIVHMIGNAHIDPVWLWTWESGVDEALATFGSAAARCEEYPEFINTRGEAWLYKQVERIDPMLFDRVRWLIHDGRWHVTGGQWVQPDANLPTETGWRRQFAHGRRYFMDRFGIRPRVAYNVDSFGHPATLPDILETEGFIGYVFHRPNAVQVPLPSQTFRWRGVGGGEVLAFRITPGYVTRTDELYGQIMLAVEAADDLIGQTMCFFGVGNHGGGPTKANIEYIIEHAHTWPDIELRFSTPQAFFDAVASSRDQLPEVGHELQHTFPGCYSAMHDIKQRQQRAEHLLEQAGRVIEVFVEEPDEKKVLHGRLDTAWDDLLFTEFHDVLAGTSIPSAWEPMRALQGRARIGGDEIIVEATRRWARRHLPPASHQQLVMINAGSADWVDVVEAEPWLDFEGWGHRWVSDLEGRPIDFQLVQPEAQQLTTRIIFPIHIGAGRSEQVLIRNDDAPPDRSVSSDLSVSCDGLSNKYVAIELEDGGVSKLMVACRNFLGGDGIRLHLRADNTDTWTFHTDRFEEPIGEVFHGCGWEVEEEGPLRARVRLDGWLGHSRVRWLLGLYRDDPRVHFWLEVAFNERFKMLQLLIHLAQAPVEWVDGLAGGHVRRYPGPAEWPMQGWSRVAFEDAHLALVTPDAYSLSLDNDHWQFTLLRSPKMAWGGGKPMVYAGRDHHTDQGVHSFHFVLHSGDHLEPRSLHSTARRQAQPPIVFDRYEGLDRPPWGNSPPPELWTGAEERAMSDGQMQHLEERPGRQAQQLFHRPDPD